MACSLSLVSLARLLTGEAGARLDHSINGQTNRARVYPLSEKCGLRRVMPAGLSIIPAERSATPPFSVLTKMCDAGYFRVGIAVWAVRLGDTILMSAKSKTDIIRDGHRVRWCRSSSLRWSIHTEQVSGLVELRRRISCQIGRIETSSSAFSFFSIRK